MESASLYYEQRSDLTPRQRRVLAAIAQGATEDGISSPCMIQISSRAGYKNPRNAQIVIRELEGLGELRVLANCGRATTFKGKPGKRYQDRNAYVLEGWRAYAGIGGDVGAAIAEKYEQDSTRVEQGEARRAEDRATGRKRIGVDPQFEGVKMGTATTGNIFLGLDIPRVNGFRPGERPAATTPTDNKTKPKPKKRKGSTLNAADKASRDAVFDAWRKTLETEFGYKLDSSQWGRERASAWNLAKRGFTPEEVCACYVDLRRSWGTSGHVSLNGIIAHVDAWKSERGTGVTARHQERIDGDALSSEEIERIIREEFEGE